MGGRPQTPSFFGTKIGGMKPYLGGTGADHGVQRARMEGTHLNKDGKNSDIYVYLFAACPIT